MTVDDAECPDAVTGLRVLTRVLLELLADQCHLLGRIEIAFKIARQEFEYVGEFGYLSGWGFLFSKAANFHETEVDQVRQLLAEGDILTDHRNTSHELHGGDRREVFHPRSMIRGTDLNGWRFRAKDGGRVLGIHHLPAVSKDARFRAVQLAELDANCLKQHAGNDDLGEDVDFARPMRGDAPADARLHEPPNS